MQRAQLPIIMDKVTRLCPGVAIIKVLMVLLLCAVVGLCPAPARASTIDYHLGVNAATGCGFSYSCASITGLTFAFTSTGGAHDVLHYTNMSGMNWHSLLLTEFQVPAIDITCTSNLFGCQIVPYGKDGARIVLRAFGNLPGVPNGKSFEIGLGCKGDCMSWPHGVTFTAVANGFAPEPATAPMLLLGVAILLVGKRSALRCLATPEAQRLRRELR